MRTRIKIYRIMKVFLKYHSSLRFLCSLDRFLSNFILLCNYFYESSSYFLINFFFGGSFLDNIKLPLFYAVVNLYL